mgnify:CR=1 FL=1
MAGTERSSATQEQSAIDQVLTHFDNSGYVNSIYKLWVNDSSRSLSDAKAYLEANDERTVGTKKITGALKALRGPVFEYVAISHLRMANENTQIGILPLTDKFDEIVEIIEQTGKVRIEPIKRVYFLFRKKSKQNNQHCSYFG